MPAPSELALASLQARMAAALLAADADGQALPEAMFAGAHPGAVGLRVHRNTLLGALSNALRLSFVAVDRLVGEAFFDRMAVEYARAMPPRAPQLDEYGAGFAAFITGFPGTENLPYLGELARFDWQFAELARDRPALEPGGPSLLLDGGARLHFLAPLRLHGARYPVDRLRDAILADDAPTLGAIDLAPGDYHYALWRTPEGVRVRPLRLASSRFLAAVYAGAGGAESLAAAAADEQGTAAAMEILAQEILPAGFVRVAA